MVWYVKHAGPWGKAKRTVYNDKIYDSKFEAGVAIDLDLRLKAKDIKKVERQVTFPLVVNGFKICSYRADFVVTHHDGTKEVIEAKGFMTQIFAMKWKLMEALYPDYTLTLIKQNSIPRMRKRGG